MASDKEENLGQTSRGLHWEYQQSWYLLSILTFWFYWLPLVYTGLRVMDFRWIFWGVMYGSPVFISQLIDPGRFGAEVFFNRAIYAALAVGSIHAFMARGEFLERLAAIADERDALREQTRLKKELAQAPCAEEGQPAGAPAEPVVARRTLFDVNAMGERDFAMLPDMGPERARQAIALRESLGAFDSFDHFAAKMGLSDKTRSRLRPLFAETVVATTDMLSAELRVLPDGTRVLEINLASVDALASLPGIGRELARKAVMLREADGPFASGEDFRYRLGLSMDTLVPLLPLISTQRTPEKQAAGARVKPSGRIMDV